MVLTLTPDQIDVAAELLKKGELVAFPTETVYGLGAPLFNPTAIGKIYTAKGRPSDNPLIAHIASLDQVPEIASEIPPEFYLLAEAFFPGPLTVVLKKHPQVPAVVSGGLETIAIRMPSHPIAHALIVAVGQPLVAPSANLSGKPSSTLAAHVIGDFEGKIAAVIDGGQTEYGIESTVISLIGAPSLLRPGAISQEAIEKVLGRPVASGADEEKRASPGTRYRHYAPQAPLKLFMSPEELKKHIQSPGKRRLILAEIDAASLYATLRKADEERYEEIILFCTPSMLQDPALMDRLQRAACVSADLRIP